MSTPTDRIRGMTCGHCMNSVEEAIGELHGVTDVNVDLERGQATVSSDADLDVEAVKTVVEEAGYESVAWVQALPRHPREHAGPGRRPPSTPLRPPRRPLAQASLIWVRSETTLSCVPAAKIGDSSLRRDEGEG